MPATPDYLAAFDSASAMARALAASLAGGRYDPMGGYLSLAALAPLTNRLPHRMRQRIYRWSGFVQSVGPRGVRAVDSERIARWVCDLYPRRRYPAIFIGSSNGAAMHLAAALDAPWLPQTVLVPVRQRRHDPDDAPGQLEAVRDLGFELLERNPDFVLHHMHDPNQDHLMVQHMSYFRLKRRQLGTAYTGFIERHLEPGGTIFILDCRTRWPVTTIGPRYFFQHGGLGGVTPEEMVRGDDEDIRRHLARQGAARQFWETPPVDTEAPESEWGYLPDLDADILRLARSGFRVVRLSIEEPDALSPLVADLLRWWYAEQGRPPDTLLVDSFILLDPAAARRIGAVPYWSSFSVENAYAAAKAYITGRPPFERIGAAVFAHGVNSIGMVPAARWLQLARDHARREGFLLGVDETKHPADLAVYFRYPRAMRRLSDSRDAAPVLPLPALDEFLDRRDEHYAVDIDRLPSVNAAPV